MEMTEKIEKALRSSSETLLALSRMAPQIARAAEAMVDAIRAGHKILVFGNGGSAADAQHIAAELMGRFYVDRRPIPAVALTTNSSNLTAIGNDLGFENVFSRQVEGLAGAGDVVIGISTSAGSDNVVRALEAARRIGAATIALTGGRDGPVDRAADLVLKVPSTDTPRIQECHIALGHVLCQMVEEAIVGDRD